MNKRLSKAFGYIFLILELAIVPKAMELMLNQPLSSLRPTEILVLAMTFGAITLCIVMSYAVLGENDSYPLHTFLFELMVFLCCIAPVTYLVSEVLDNTGRNALNMFVNTVYYLTGINIAYTILSYELLIVGYDNNPGLRKIKNIATVLTIIDNIATLLNVKLGYFFTITENGSYQSSDTYFLAFIIPAIVIAFTVYVAVTKIKKGRQKSAFTFYWVFAILTSYIESIHPELQLQYTGYALTLVVIYINIQSELDALVYEDKKEGGILR